MNWPDWPLWADVATVVGGVGGLIGAGTKTVRVVAQRRASRPKRFRREVELVPIRFQVSLNPGPPPAVSVTLRAVNYTTKPVHLVSARIRLLRFGAVPPLDEIPCLDEYEVPAGTSREMYFRRKLAESEIAQLRSSADVARSNQGDIAFTAKARLGKRDLQPIEEHNLTICGSVEGLPVSDK